MKNNTTKKSQIKKEFREKFVDKDMPTWLSGSIRTKFMEQFLSSSLDTLATEVREEQKESNIKKVDMEDVLQKIRSKLFATAHELDDNLNTERGITKPEAYRNITLIWATAFQKKKDIDDILEQLQSQGEKE